MSKMILRTSPEAAKYVNNISGWVSRHGNFFGMDDASARWDGCTHVPCNRCGIPVKKLHTMCEQCREKLKKRKYEELEKVEWDEITPVYSQVYDVFFNSYDEILDFTEDHQTSIEDLLLVICKPEYLSEVDADYWEYNFPDDWDGMLPGNVQKALDNLNQEIRKAGPVSWTPGDKAVIIHHKT